MVRRAITVASEGSIDQVFSVFYGLGSLETAVRQGYEGIELSVRDSRAFDITAWKAATRAYSIQVAAISTSQVCLERGLTFLVEETAARHELVKTLKGFVELAEVLGQRLTLGRIKGETNGRNREYCRELFMEVLVQIGNYALKRGVEICIEPLNRTESDFINNAAEAVELIQSSGLSNIRLLLDSYHMAIEEQSAFETIQETAEFISYFHVCDSNRCYPGSGHIDFPELIQALAAINYNGWFTVEIMPVPTPKEAALRAIEDMKFWAI